MAAKFEIYKDKAGEFRFRLKATNGQTILASEGYKARAGRVNRVESVRKNAANEARYERKTTESGKYRFNLKSGNNQVIGTSESYETEKARDGGIESVKKNAPVAIIVDKTRADGGKRNQRSISRSSRLNNPFFSLKGFRGSPSLQSMVINRLAPVFQQ